MFKYDRVRPLDAEVAVDTVSLVPAFRFAFRLDLKHLPHDDAKLSRVEPLGAVDAADVLLIQFKVRFIEHMRRREVTTAGVEGIIPQRPHHLILFRQQFRTLP